MNKSKPEFGIYYDPIDIFYSENNRLYKKIEKEIGEPFVTPEYYLKQIKSKIIFEKNREITFYYNKEEPVHRWSPYLEGFSSSFVKDTFQELRIKKGHTVLDPLAGCGTLNVTSKMNNIDSIGIEINPMVHFILKTKLNWDIDISKFIRIWKSFNFERRIEIEPPRFLRSEKQFNKPVLDNILKIQQEILNVKNSQLQSLFKMAFASILLECSNLRRSPSIGYDKNKNVPPDKPIKMFNDKVKKIIDDLKYVSQLKTDAKADTYNEDSRSFKIVENSVDFVITSPPYLNFFDYVGNYKLEIGWLGFANSTKELRELRDSMVVCDNVSRKFIQNYSKQKKIYSNSWLDEIENKLCQRMIDRPNLRRNDYNYIIRKYFEDIYKVMNNVHHAMKNNGCFVLVVGDSLVADVYVPTDLIIAKIGEDIGFNLKKIEIVRSRRSGIRQSFKLRESVTYLKKEQ